MYTFTGSQHPDPHAEDKLHLLGTLFDLVPDFLVVSDMQSRCLYANRAAAQYFSMSKQEVRGQLLRGIAPPEFTAQHEQQLQSIAVGGEPAESPVTPYLRPDGTKGYMRAYVIPFEEQKEGQTRVLTLMRDITSGRQLVAEQATNAALQRELDIAHRIQKSLLPDGAPDVAGFQIAARCEPAVFAGGDFYDFIPTRNGTLVAVIGDVTGHGVGPALIATAVRSYARMLLPDKSLIEAMLAIDRELRADLTDGAFVTLAFLALYPGSANVDFLSAGHGPVVLAGNGSVRRLKTHGTPAGLGVFPTDAQPTRLVLSPGSVLLMPSDGMFEAKGASAGMFGIDRLADQVCPRSSPEVVVQRCFEAVEQWAGGSPPADDRTLVVVAKMGAD